MAYRTVKGTIYHTDGVTPWKNAKVIFTSKSTLFTVDKQYPSDVKVVSTNSFGEMLVNLVCSDDLNPVYYECLLPGKNDKFSFTLSCGTTPITLFELKQQSTPVTAPATETIKDYIDSISGNLTASTAKIESLNYESNENISALKVVALQNNKLKLASATNTDDCYTIIGVSTQAINAGANSKVLQYGIIVDDSFNFYSNMPIYLGKNGTLSQDVAIGAQFLLQVAVALTQNQILVDIQEAIIYE